jgi:hypothetical protein
MAPATTTRRGAPARRTTSAWSRPPRFVEARGDHGIDVDDSLPSRFGERRVPHVDVHPTVAERAFTPRRADEDARRVAEHFEHAFPHRQRRAQDGDEHRRFGEDGFHGRAERSPDRDAGRFEGFRDLVRHEPPDFAESGPESRRVLLALDAPERPEMLADDGIRSGVEDVGHGGIVPPGAISLTPGAGAEGDPFRPGPSRPAP